MNNELPQGWAPTTLGEICSKPQYGWTCKAAKDGRVKYVRTTDISDGQINWSTVPFCAEAPDDIEKYRVRTNDIIVSRAGSVGVSYRIKDVPCDAVFASYLIRFNPLDGIEPKFVEAFLKSKDYWKEISDFTAGIAIPNVNASKLASLELPLAPCAEQRRIVAKLERLLDQVDACQARLAMISALLKRFRQSVLAAACSGRLTADWREENGVSTEESWRDAELRDICSSITDGDHLPPPKRASGIPFLTIGNISSGRLDFSETRFVPESYFASIKPDRIPKRGDTLYTVVGATIGIPVLVDTDRAFCFQRHIAILKPSKGTAPKLLHALMGSPAIFREAWARITGTAQPTLPLGNLRSIPISIPSLPEQEEIVRRIESLFALADRIEARFGEGRKRVDSITQAILAKAFRGELVPTEFELAKAEGRSFESAEELLKRIKRNAEPKGKKTEGKGSDYSARHSRKHSTTVTSLSS